MWLKKRYISVNVCECWEKAASIWVKSYTTNIARENRKKSGGCHSFCAEKYDNITWCSTIKGGRRSPLYPPCRWWTRWSVHQSNLSLLWQCEWWIGLLLYIHLHIHTHSHLVRTGCTTVRALPFFSNFLLVSVILFLMHMNTLVIKNTTMLG